MRSIFPKALPITLLFLATIGSAGTANADDQPTLRETFEKARQIHNIRKSALPAYVLTGTISFFAKKNEPVQGLYRLVSTPEGRWKEELKFPGFSRVRIGDGKQFIEVQDPSTPIPILNELDLLLNFNRLLAIGKEDSLKKAKTSKASENCLKRTISSNSEELFCFDSQTGNFLSRQKLSAGTYGIALADTEEFTDFQTWNGKIYPRTLRSFVRKQLWIEVKLDEFKALPTLPANFFESPPAAQTWSDCEDLSAWKLKDRFQPAYPQSARANREQGIVTLYAVIESDGKVHDLQLVHSAAPSLDQSSMQAVSLWRYEPVGCSGSPGRTRTYIDVIFTLMN